MQVGAFQQEELSLPTIPPRIYREYEAAEAGLGARVMQMIADEGEHRRRIMRDDFEAGKQLALARAAIAPRGQWLAFTSLMLVLFFSWVTAKTIPDSVDAVEGIVKTALIVFGTAFVGGKAADALASYFSRGSGK